MHSNRETLLCQYQYDPLDRLIDCALAEQVSIERFYLKDRLATEIEGAVQRSIMQHEDQLLAERQRQNDSVETHFLATDQHRSVLNVLNPAQHHPVAYTAFGHRPRGNGVLSLLGFNGERSDPVTGCYLLGNGYRAFNPVLMRFNSPDSWSPFGEGGLNAYAYCVGDPVNRIDPTGHLGNPIKGLLHIVGLRTPRRLRTNPAAAAVAQLQTPASASPLRQLGPAPEAPPPYTTAPLDRPYGGMSDLELNVLPPPYSPSGTSFVHPRSPMTRRPSVIASRTNSTPNLPHPSSLNTTPSPPPITRQQARIQSRLAELEDHRQRITEATRTLPLDQFSDSLNSTMANLDLDIASLRLRL